MERSSWPVLVPMRHILPPSAGTTLVQTILLFARLPSPPPNSKQRMQTVHTTTAKQSLCQSLRIVPKNPYNCVDTPRTFPRPPAAALNPPPFPAEPTAIELLAGMADQNGQMTSISRPFCAEDLVRLKDVTRTSMGLVDRTFGDVETHEPRPQSDYGVPIERHPHISKEDHESFLRSGIPPRGAVVVVWHTEKVELIPEDHLTLVDRRMCVGDIVKRKLEDAVSGVVLGTKITCSLYPTALLGTNAPPGAAIHGVPSHELRSVHDLSEGALIIYQNWLGRIRHIHEEVAVRLSDNSVVVVEEPEDLTATDGDLNPRLGVGQRVTTKKANLRRGLWKYGAYSPNIRPEGIVVETRITEVEAEWLWPGPSPNPGSTFTPQPHPPLVLELDDIESPNFYVYDVSASAEFTLPLKENGVDRIYHVADVCAGDRVRFNDLQAAATKYSGPPAQFEGRPQGKVEIIPRTETLGYDMNVFTVIATDTKATVRWQDLTVTETSARELISDPTHAEVDEAWPGEVIGTYEERKDKTDAAYVEPAKVGVVQSVQSADRIATVRWYENPEVRLLLDDILPPCKTGKLQAETEDISLYDIRTIQNLTHHQQDFVVILPPDGTQVEPGRRDWCGEIVDLGLDGKVTVRLGMATPIRDIRVDPEFIRFISAGGGHDDYLNDTSMAMDGDSEFTDDYMSDYWGEDWDTDSLHEAAEMWIEYEEGMRADPDGSLDDDEWSTEDEEDESQAEDIPPHTGASDAARANGEDTEMHNTREASATPDVNDLTTRLQSLPQDSSSVSTSIQASGAGTPPEFDPEVVPSFLILDTPPPSDHHWIHLGAGTASNFLKRVTKEHKILRSSLPPGIFVRTWESRLNILRVLLIGPQDTPYEYAPFVIDLHIPPAYPNEPPQAYFHSWTNGSGPINPNLYEDGKICLSLLGTWHADQRNESWSAKSTLLQVLVSIHALVLNKDPYYNEAGYDVHRAAPETKLSSALYSERAYFRARAFITHALSNSIEPFNTELKYLYLSKEDKAPKLLDRAIEAAKEVVERSKKDGRDKDAGEKDGLRRVSRGAVVMLQRQVEKLEELKASKAKPEEGAIA